MKVSRAPFTEVPRELARFAEQLAAILDEYKAVINGRLSLGDAQGGSANIDGQPIEVADTGLVDTEFTVQHNLGRIPIYYLYTIDKAGTVYDSQRSLWTSSTLRLKCSAANASLKIFVFG